MDRPPVAGPGGSLSTYQHIATWLERTAVERGRFAAVGFYTTNYYDPRARSPRGSTTTVGPSVDSIRSVRRPPPPRESAPCAFDTEPYPGAGGVKHDDQWSDIGPATGGADPRGTARARRETLWSRSARPSPRRGLTELLVSRRVLPAVILGRRAARHRRHDRRRSPRSRDRRLEGVIYICIEKITFQNAFTRATSCRTTRGSPPSPRIAPRPRRTGRSDSATTRAKPDGRRCCGSTMDRPQRLRVVVFSPDQEQHQFTAALSRATGPVVMYGHRFAGGFDYSPYVAGLRAGTALG